MRAAREEAAGPNALQSEKRAKTTTATPRNQKSLGNLSEPVNPEVGAPFDPGGPVMTATTSAAATHMPRRRIAGLAPRPASRADRAIRGGESAGSSNGRASIPG